MSGFEDLDNEDIERLKKIFETHKKIINLRKQGKSIEEIAKTVGWNFETIKVVLGANQDSPDYKKNIKD